MTRLDELWYSRDARGGALLRAGLRVASWLYRSVINIRNALFEARLLKQTRVSGVRTISVGNLVVGGSGKTPAVIFLAQRAVALGLRVAVLSRGYGRRSRRAVRVRPESTVEEVGDEPLLIARRCPTVQVWVGPSRRALAYLARADGAQLLILDDGFQHRALVRDEDIVVIDEAEGHGNGRLLPAGPLREPPSALDRATLVWLRTSGDDRRAPLPPIRVPLVRARYGAAWLISPAGERLPPTALSGRQVVPLTGIARPQRLLSMLERLGASVSAPQVYGDHHAFTQGELARAETLATGLGALLVTTEKDHVRMPPSVAVWRLGLEVEVESGMEVVDRALVGGVSPQKVNAQ